MRPQKAITSGSLSSHHLITPPFRMETQRREPWAVSDAPADYIDKMLQGIVGLTLTITEVSAKTKASQNRTPADQRGALEGLRTDPAAAEAAEIIAQRLKD